MQNFTLILDHGIDCFDVFICAMQVVWVSFTSTTTDKSQTLRQFGNGGTFFKIKTKYGRDIGPLSLFPTEREILLLPNSVFVVKSVLSSEEVPLVGAAPLSHLSSTRPLLPPFVRSACSSSIDTCSAPILHPLRGHPRSSPPANHRVTPPWRGRPSIVLASPRKAAPLYIYIYIS